MLKDTILKFLKMDSLIENMTGYVETRIELMKMEMKEEVSKVLAKALIFVVLTSVFTLFILLISMAAAYKIGESLGAFGGFAVVAGFYFLIGLLVFLLKDSIAGKIEVKLKEIMKKKRN